MQCISTQGSSTVWGMEGTRVYLPSLYDSERAVADVVATLARRGAQRERSPSVTDRVDRWIDQQIKKQRLRTSENEFCVICVYVYTASFTAVLSKGQRAAIHAAATAPVVVVTGGPGCGKTLVIGALVRLWQDMHRARVSWMSPEEEAQLQALQAKGRVERHCHEGRRSHIRLAAPTGSLCFGVLDP